jgi:hypothetical protein
MATNTAVIVLCDEAVLIWAIPPLLPQPPDYSDRNPTHIIHMPPPLFTIPFPEISHYPARMRWNTISSWYFGSSHPLYFDMLCQDSKLHRFKIMLRPDLSTASLCVINTSEHSPLDFDDIVFFDNYRICEDTLISCWIYEGQHQDPIPYQYGVYTGLTSVRFANVTSDGRSAAKVLLPDTGHLYLLYSCPASGRFVLVDSLNSVTIVDLF